MDNNACLYEGGDMDFMISMCRHKQVEYRLRNISLMPPKMKFMVQVDSHDLFLVARITSIVRWLMTMGMELVLVTNFRRYDSSTLITNFPTKLFASIL